MIVGDLVRGAAVGTIGIMSLTGTLTLPWLITLAVVSGAGQATFEPAFMSIVPTIVTSDLLVDANSLGQFVRPITWTLIGPLIGGALVAGAGTGWAFIGDAGTFVFSATMIALMRTRRPYQQRGRAWCSARAASGLSPSRSPWVSAGACRDER
jgi:MFS family permease